MSKLIVVKNCWHCPFRNEDVDYGDGCLLYFAVNPEEDPKGYRIRSFIDEPFYTEAPETPPDWCPLNKEKIEVELEE